MDLEKASLVLCITLFLVIGINAAIYAAVRRGNHIGQIEMFRRAAHRLKNPWGQEDENLKELSERVMGLNKRSENQSKD